MPDTETERDVGSVFADFGGVEVPNTRVPTGSLEEVLTDFGATPVVTGCQKPRLNSLLQSPMLCNPVTTLRILPVTLKSRPGEME